MKEITMQPCLVLFIQPGFRSKHYPRSVSAHKWGGLMHSWFYGQVKAEITGPRLIILEELNDQHLLKALFLFIMPVQVHLKLVTLFGDTRQKMHKQLSQGENQGAYSYSVGLISNLIAVKPSKFNSFQALASHIKPELGACPTQYMSPQRPSQIHRRNEHPVFWRLNAHFSEYFTVLSVLIISRQEELCSQGTESLQGQLQAQVRLLGWQSSWGPGLAHTPSHGNLEWGIALRGRFCLAGGTLAQALCRDVLSQTEHLCLLVLLQIPAVIPDAAERSMLSSNTSSFKLCGFFKDR